VFQPNSSWCGLHPGAYAPQPNRSFNADATAGHAFGIFMACSGALRASRCGAG
jgi:hypothetical protein